MTNETLMTATEPTQVSSPDSQSATAHVVADAAAAGKEVEAGQQAQSNGDPAPEDGKSDAAEADTKPAEGAPEAYEFKPIEGQVYDNDIVNRFSEVAKELNLTQSAAQRLLDTVGMEIQTNNAKKLEAFNSKWIADSKADKEFGGDKFDANMAITKKALDKFGSPELRTLLQESGLGNNPELIRAFYRAGMAISEDSFVPGSSHHNGGEKQGHAATLYPKK